MVGWLVMAALVAAVIAAGPMLNGPERMALVCLALFFGFKSLTWPRRRAALYLLWPGLDPRPFEGDRAPDPTAAVLLGRGILVMTAGSALLLIPAPLLAKAWLVVAAFIMTLHLGLFEAMAGALRWAGFGVERICPSPWLARSASEFWSRRWNTAFHAAVRDHVYKPLARRWGRGIAVAAVFMFSGLLHELALSFPAGGGWGLPTLYFALQGAIVLLEKWGLLRGTRLTTLLFVLLPLPMIVHTPLLSNVIFPLVTP